MRKLFHGLLCASLILCVNLNSFAEDDEDDSEDLSDYPNPYYNLTKYFDRLTPAPTPADATRVEKIEPLSEITEEVPADVLKEVEKQIPRLESDDFPVREAASKKLVELGKKNPGLYHLYNKELAKHYPPETRYRLKAAIYQVAPVIRWDQVRWILFEKLKAADTSQELIAAAASINAKLSKEDRAKLAENAKLRPELMKNAPKVVYNPYNGRTSPVPEKKTEPKGAKVATLESIWADDMAIYEKAATEAGYKVTVQKVTNQYMVVRTMELMGESNNLKMSFSKNDSIYSLESNLYPAEPVVVQPEELFSEDLTLPNGELARKIGKVQAYAKVVFDGSGKAHLFLQQVPSGVAYLDDPLYIPTQILKGKFPQSMKELDSVHLTKEARIKALEIELSSQD